MKLLMPLPGKINFMFGKIKKWIFFASGIFFLFTLSGVLTYKFMPVWYTPLMFGRTIEKMADGKKIHFSHHWVPYHKISPYMVQAAIAAEDNNFAHHFGIDFQAIKKAYQYNRRGKKIRGASTITQQTCKNVFLWQGRNYIRKGLEVYYTLMVETFWSKKHIMEVYLNSIEMGDGIYGIEAASEHYFKKPASRLTRNEAALIAAIFPNPRKRNPAAPSAYLINRQQKILWLMDKIGKQSL